MTTEEREAGWITETILLLVSRAEVWPAETVRASIVDLRRIADESPDPNVGGALLRICGALEGICEA